MFLMTTEIHTCFYIVLDVNNVEPSVHVHTGKGCVTNVTVHILPCALCVYLRDFTQSQGDTFSEAILILQEIIKIMAATTCM